MSRPASCAACPHSAVSPDPDPDDWFNDDDELLRCTLLKLVVVSGCRPYAVERETTPPPTRCPIP